MVSPAPVTPVDNKEARKHEQIIRAALRVFAEHGLHGTPVPPIAAEAGVGVGTLYRYFDSKETLINAVFRDSKSRLKERLLSGIDHEVARPGVVKKPNEHLREINNQLGFLLHFRIRGSRPLAPT